MRSSIFFVLKSQPFSFFYKYAYLRALCMSVLLVYFCVWHMDWNPWNYSYRWLWVTMCALETKPGYLQEQHVPQTTKLPLQLPPTAILFFTATTIAQWIESLTFLNMLSIMLNKYFFVNMNIIARSLIQKNQYKWLQIIFSIGGAIGIIFSQCP